MKKVEDLVKQILKEYKLEPKDEINTEISSDNNGFKIVITGNLKNGEFIKYLQDMDDELFREACENFEDMTGITLNDFANDVNPELFKRVVSKICQKKISDLTRYIQ